MLFGRKMESGEFEAVALPHMNDLFRTALHLVRDRSAAQDLVQEAYLQAWKAFHRFEPGTSIPRPFRKASFLSKRPWHLSRRFRTAFRTKIYWRPWTKFQETFVKWFCWQTSRNSLTGKSRRCLVSRWER